ncbi:MAG: NUDIX domain-containing protein [Gemmatimonadaceae bacterium]|nr:NUDIX domain-containing protein [Gemmatimonadaceae bacterium]
MSTEPNRPKVGVAVIVHRSGRVLLGRRISAHGTGTWQFPGGHLEFGETPTECAVREVWEETGLGITALREGPWTNDVFAAEGRHYLTVFMLAEWDSGEAEVREPDKCDEWGWFDWEHLPEPLFLPVANLRRRGYRPF